MTLLRAVLAVAMMGCGSSPADPAPERPARVVRPVPQPVIERGDADLALQAVADAAGAGWIACELGMAPRGTIVAEGLERVEVVGSVLRALVDVPTGAAGLAAIDTTGPFPDPVAVLRWSGAHPGARGVCEVGEAKFVPVRVQFVDPDDNRLARAEIEPLSACWGLDAPLWDGAGGLRMRALAGVPCSVWLHRGGSEAPVSHVVRFTVEQAAQLTMALGPATEGEPTARAALATPEQIASARSREDLTVGARAVLDRWAEQAPVTIRDTLKDLIP